MAILAQNVSELIKITIRTCLENNTHIRTVAIKVNPILIDLNPSVPHSLSIALPPNHHSRSSSLLSLAKQTKYMIHEIPALLRMCLEIIKLRMRFGNHVKEFVFNPASNGLWNLCFPVPSARSQRPRTAVTVSL